MDLVMTVRDHEALAGSPVERWDAGFDRARAVKSAWELDAVRESMRINEAGVQAVMDAWEPGRTEAELMAAAEQAFVARGTRRLTMDMVLTGPAGAALPEMRLPDEKRRSPRTTCSSTAWRSPGRTGSGSSSAARCAAASRARSRSG
jgi:Xaa-Pro aminopeptidase